MVVPGMIRLAGRTLRYEAPDYLNAYRAVRLIGCLLYTSDAADERSSVDLGGRRIIKKKKRHKTRAEGRYEKNRERETLIE